MRCDCHMERERLGRSLATTMENAHHDRQACRLTHSLGHSQTSQNRMAIEAACQLHRDTVRTQSGIFKSVSGAYTYNSVCTACVVSRMACYMIIMYIITLAKPAPEAIDSAQLIERDVVAAEQTTMNHDNLPQS
jgi:hypothetical protein